MNIIEQLQKIKPKPSIQQPQETLQFIAGLWINGQYYWLQDCKEKLFNDDEIIIKVKEDQPHSKIRLSSVYISNHSKEMKEVKILAMHYYPNVIQDNMAFVSPTDKRIFHLANENIYLVNGEYNGIAMKEYTVMPQWRVFTDQIWSSLQKGSLNYHPMIKSPAASIFTMKMTLGSHESGKMNTWTISGTNKNELLSMEQALLKETERQQ
jgi:hypothetical protein